MKLNKLIMSKSQKSKYYLIYKTTNLINKKIYVGKHVTTNPNDNYLGSGLVLKRAMKKYGRKNFKKEILHYLSSYEEMDQKERDIVNENFIKRQDTYNLILGGGCDCKKISEVMKGKKFTEEHKKKIKENHADVSGYKNPFYNKKHSNKTKQKIAKRDYSNQSNENHWTHKLDKIPKSCFKSGNIHHKSKHIYINNEYFGSGTLAIKKYKNFITKRILKRIHKILLDKKTTHRIL